MEIFNNLIIIKLDNTKLNVASENKSNKLLHTNSVQSVGWEFTKLGHGWLIT